MKKFDNQLRDWQGARTDAQAAADLGVNLRTYHGWKSGRNKPRGLTLTAVLARISTPERKGK